jgi:CelD/BcsL family acetyltransferase involved in cellulose biosynthesis
VLRDDDRDVAVVPLYVTRKGLLRVAWFVGHGRADVVGPVCAPDDRVRAWSAFRAVQHRDGDWDILIGHGIRSDEQHELGGRPSTIASGAFPTIRVESDWDHYLASRTRNLRQKTRARTRKLAREHRVQFRRCTDEDRFNDDFSTFVRLHRARWSGDGVFDPVAEAFHREFAAIAFRAGWLRLWFLDIEGRSVAAALAYRYGGVDALYQVGRDPSWDRAAVGFVLLAHVVRDAFESRMREFRFLRGDEHYKYRFATHDPRIATVVAPRTYMGRTALAAAGLVSRATRRPRALLTLAERPLDGG